MDELIAKSKMYKAEKAKQRDDDEELLDKLDEDFKVISRGVFIIRQDYEKQSAI